MIQSKPEPGKVITTLNKDVAVDMADIMTT
mgnify:CR=1 FL=1